MIEDLKALLGLPEEIDGALENNFPLTVLRGKAFPGRKMILRDIWMISGHIWMIIKNQRKVR